MARLTVQECDRRLKEIDTKIKQSADKIDGLLSLQREWERLRNEAAVAEMVSDLVEEPAAPCADTN